MATVSFNNPRLAVRDRDKLFRKTKPIGDVREGRSADVIRLRNAAVKQKPITPLFHTESPLHKEPSELILS
ncbi:hypothetical protein M3J09_008122 [Ascochyta lentis]